MLCICFVFGLLFSWMPVQGYVWVLFYMCLFLIYFLGGQVCVWLAVQTLLVLLGLDRAVSHDPVFSNSLGPPSMF